MPFFLSSGTEKAFDKLKEEIRKTLLHSRDKSLHLIFNTAATHYILVAALLNQADRLVAFFLQTPSEIKSLSN